MNDFEEAFQVTGLCVEFRETPGQTQPWFVLGSVRGEPVVLARHDTEAGALDLVRRIARRLQEGAP